MANIQYAVHYAHSAHGQPNVNLASASKKSNWSNESKSCASDVTRAPGGSAYAQYMDYTVKMTVPGMKKKQSIHYQKTPWTFTGLEFQFNIPDCAYIRNIKFEVPMKIEGTANIHSPQARFNFYNGTKSVKDTISNDTGWNGGYYYSASNQTKLSQSWTTHTYSMSGDDFRKRGYPISECGSSRFGIDLRWKEPTKMTSNVVNVHIQYVKCTIEYELADENIYFDKYTSGNNPRLINCGESYTCSIDYYNSSNASCCGNTSKDLQLTLPPNTRILNAHVYDYTPGNNFADPFVIPTKVWTVKCIPNAHYKLVLELLDYGNGLDKITLTGQDRKDDYWVYTVPNKADVGDVKGYAETMQKDVSSCLFFESQVVASDGVADYYIDVSRTGGIEHTGSSDNLTNVTWTLDKEKSSDGVWLDSYSTYNHVKVHVPANKYVSVVFKGCFKPLTTGEKYATYKLGDNGVTQYIDYNVIDPPTYVIRNTPKLDEFDRTTEEIRLNQSIINIRTHRVASSTEIGAYVIDCGIADLDGTMIEDECTLSASVWEKIDYIGCVPLEYHHYDPESTYSNKGISESYKNKTYKGKEGIVEEDISLKFKARPTQVPTLQGLVKLDKPTPINANWRCFEGDPLNHRGWAVLSEIKAKRTNPLWYDCEAKVDYITHDIHTKFQIFKELQVTTSAMPDIMAETFELGGNLSTGLDSFNVDTDGGFIYDDGQDGAKNLFSLDEGQHLMISTVRPLSNVSQVRFDWYSTKIREIRENTMERVFRIKDADGNSVLEYEYTNFNFYEEYTTCDVVVRVKTEGDYWKPQYYEMDLRTEIEADPIASDGGETPTEIVVVEDTIYYQRDEDLQGNPVYTVITDSTYEGDRYVYDETTQDYVLVEDDDDDDEEAYDPQYIAPTFDPQRYDVTTIYGSSIEFILNGNTLTIYDSGYNGREIEIGDITLLKSESYTFESYWENHNVDGTTEDVLSYIDVGLSETILDTKYSQTYNNLIVSPFPIPYKTVVFTRESEEGTIFYLTGEEPFKYMIEPYYQFHCGCDLVTREGISIFDLNNSHTYFYIENGLVRLGFNKFNGRLYLAKWDIVSKSWVSTHYFHMSSDTKFSLETYSDDKIVIKAGTDTFFTIWRGHPFIGIKNPNDEIFIDVNFNYCLSDKVEGVAYEYPRIHSFMNFYNLLPECVGGTKIDYTCFDVDDDDVTPGTLHEITIEAPSTNPIAGEEVAIDVTVTPSTTDGSVHYIINGKDEVTVTSPFDLVYTFQEGGAYTIQAVYVGDEDDGVAISEKITIKVDTPEPRQDSEVHEKEQQEERPIPGEYHLQIVSAPSKFTYNDKQKVVLQLTKGSYLLHGYPVELQLPSGTTETAYTQGGFAEIVNWKYTPGNYQWGGRFYDGTDEDHNRRLIEPALKYIKIEKATPYFTYNATNGKINKGKYLHVWLNGVTSVLKNQNITYTIGKGSKKTKKTNDSGKIYIPFNQIGTYTVELKYAGSKNYKAIRKEFTIKVVK